MADQNQKAKRGFLFTLLALLGLSLFFYFNFKTVVVRGPSMEPRYKAGARLLASKAYWLIGPIQKKDVVVIKDPLDPSGYIIKRVLALPGEAVDFENLGTDYPLSRGEFRVPERHLYVIGDNRSVSEDSRRFGPINAETVLGKVVHVNVSNPTLSGIVLIAVLLAAGFFWCLTRIVFQK